MVVYLYQSKGRDTRPGRGSTMTREAMIYWYNRTAGAHKYLVGFVKFRKLYYVMMGFQELSTMLKPDVTGKLADGSTHKKLRVRMSSDQAWMYLQSGRAVEIGTADDLAVIKGVCANRGEAFEKFIVETMTGETWHRDNTPYYKRGDMNLDGEEIQIKLDSATLTTETVVCDGIKYHGLAA